MLGRKGRKDRVQKEASRPRLQTRSLTNIKTNGTAETDLLVNFFFLIY